MVTLGLSGPQHCLGAGTTSETLVPAPRQHWASKLRLQPFNHEGDDV